MTEAEGSPNVIIIYSIYSNKRRGAYKNFHASDAALIRWRRLFESQTRQKNYFNYGIIIFRINLLQN